MTETLEEFIARNEIKHVTRDADNNPHMADRDNMNHYRVTLRCENRRIIVPFSQGYGINTMPNAVDVLDCLASDVAGYLNTSCFEDWCIEYGYDTDSRKAEKAFKAIEKEHEQLRRLLGEREMEVLLWNVVRE